MSIKSTFTEDVGQLSCDKVVQCIASQLVVLPNKIQTEISDRNGKFIAGVKSIY